MKISYADYIKKIDVSVLVAEAIFNELKKNFPIKRIEDIAETTSGGTPLRNNDDYYGGNIPWIKSGELNDKTIDIAEEFITEKGLANSSAKLHPKGTLLIAMYGATTGKTGITGIKAATNQAICAVFPKLDIERDYLYWFFRSHRYKYIEISKGGAQPNISQSVILKTKLPIPGNKIQKQIVSILEQVDKNDAFDVSVIPMEYRDVVNRIFSSKNNVAIIETEFTHQLNLLKKLKQQILQDAVQGKLVKQNPKDEPASVLLEKIKVEKEKLFKENKLKPSKPLPPIKEDEIPFQIPENWVWCRLGEITTYGSSEKSEPKMLKENTWVLDLEDIEKETSILLNKVRFSERNSLSTKSIFKKGDVLYSKLRPYLDKVIVADEDGVCTTEILPFVCFANFNPNYFKITLKQKSFLNYVNGVTRGMKMPRLGTKEGQIALIPLPPLSEQHRIVLKVEELIKKCNELEASIKQGQTYTDQLMQSVLRDALKPVGNV